MGRDYNRLRGHGGDGDGDGGAVSSSKSKRKANAVNGCMSAFYHLFDFQHLYFSSHHHHHLNIDSPSRLKGLKFIEESLPSTTYKDKQSLNIPVSMRVRTEKETTRTRLRALVTDTSTCSSEICNSPAIKTPNLVARLMGLDLLPDKTDLNHSLSSRLTSHRFSNKATRLGTRSLPDSPRISSTRKSDFDIHRLSLQLNKENKHEEIGCSRLKLIKQDQEETQSPRDYARQIVKQIKERVVNRRVVGIDITNSVKNREAVPSQNCNELRRDTTVSCSPRTRFSDKENKPRTSHKPNLSSSYRPEQITQKPKKLILVSVSKASREKQSKNRVKQRELRPINLCKKAESETRFSSRPLKPSPIKQREAFLSESRDAKAKHCSKPLQKKRSKNIPKSYDLDNITPTGPPQKQKNETEGLKSNEDASICSKLIHKIEQNSPQVARNYKLDDEAATVSAFSITWKGNDSEQNNITRVINLAGINTDSAKKLDPRVLRKLEHILENQSGSLALRCNRKLLFDLMNEILIETVEEVHAKQSRNHHGSELIGELFSAVSSYQIPGEIAPMDVDSLLETKKLEDEGEEMIAEIERDIIDALIRETASELNLLNLR